MIVWLASYPRSGNTLLRILLKQALGLETYSLHGDSTDIASDDQTAAIVGHRHSPRELNIEAMRVDDSLHLVKTHQAPPNATDKAIYLVRDGRASVASYFHYRKSFARHKGSIWDVLAGSVPFGTWGSHLVEWDPLSRKNTLLLKFEDLAADPNEYVEPIADFLGVESSSSAIPSFEELHRMNPKFFRKGVADSWKEDLVGESLYVFWAINFDQMNTYYPKETSSELEPISAAFESGRVNRDFLEPLVNFVCSLGADRLRLLNRSDSLESQLSEERERLTEIRHASGQLTEVKVILAPLEKYKKYKSLIETIRSEK